jgi:pyruvate/2-oxoglutarate/acetoin dehydrogenase E1 component
MTGSGSRISYEEAITEALRLEMYRDSSVVLFSSGGSAPELARLFGAERVVEGITPAAPVVLAAAGAAGEGQRPVCEVSATGPGPLDHIAELGALHASNGGGSAPVTVCLRFGGALADGGAAGRDPGAWLVGAPGVKVVEPATPADAKGLLTAAIRDPEPVCVLEHIACLDSVDMVPEGGHVVELGRARLVREGERLTLVAHGAAVALAEEAAEQIDLDADVLDLRSLQPLDREGVLTSVSKTGRLVIVEPSPSAARVTAELISQIWQEAFEYLDAPPRRIRIGEGVPDAEADRDVEAIMETCLELLGY